MNNAVSGQPSAGIAGGAADPLKSAFDEAAKGIDFGDMKFATGADEPWPKEEQPGDTESAPEIAAEGDQGEAATAENEARDGKSEQPRIKGKFATKEDAEAAAKTEAKAEPKKLAETSAALSAPAHWDGPTREAFGKLPPDAQRLLLEQHRRLESGFTRKSQELTEDKRFADSVRSLVTENHRAQMAAAGIKSEAEGIGFLLKLQDFATQRPEDYGRWVFQSLKIDPRRVFPELSRETNGQQPVGEAQGHPIDPRYIQQLVQQQTQPLAQRLASFEREKQENARRLQEEAEASAGEIIAKFRTATNADGSLKNPHYERVYEAMVRHSNDPDIAAIPDRGERLAAAYDRAVYADKELRAELVNSEVERLANERRAADEVAKARRAAPAIKGASASVKRKPVSLDDAVRDAFQKVGAG